MTHPPHESQEAQSRYWEIVERMARDHRWPQYALNTALVQVEEELDLEVAARRRAAPLWNRLSDAQARAQCLEDRSRIRRLNQGVREQIHRAQNLLEEDVRSEEKKVRDRYHDPTWESVFKGERRREMYQLRLAEAREPLHNFAFLAEAALLLATRQRDRLEEGDRIEISAYREVESQQRPRGVQASLRQAVTSVLSRLGLRRGAAHLAPEAHPSLEVDRREGQTLPPQTDTDPSLASSHLVLQQGPNEPRNPTPSTEERRAVHQARQRQTRQRQANNPGIEGPELL
jgi:hypothetical protein